MQKGILLFLFPLFSVFSTGCFRVVLPEMDQKPQTLHYALQLPAESKPLPVPVTVARFISNTPAKFRMLSRRGTEIKFDPHAKWTDSPSMLLSSAFSALYGSDDANYESAQYLLECDVYTFERNLDTGTADLNVLYRLINRKTRKVIFSKELNTAIPLKGNTASDFAEAMSEAVVKQSEMIRREIESSVSGKSS
jgi:ABC-type uncharacterized transport system auxiliary subunit